MKETDTVLTSRVRLARNWSDLPFPGRNPDGALCRDRAEETAVKLWQKPVVYTAADAKNPQALCEAHLMTGDLLANPDGAAYWRSDLRLGVLVNEEDHLRIQSLQPGLNLKLAWENAAELEAALGEEHPFSFDEKLGYLTSCPTSTGTGMRASLVLHLPMITAQKRVGEVIQSVAKLGLNLRGIYGEGSEALGDLYLLSNQVTLGRAEAELLEAVSAVGTQLGEIEEGLRAEILEKSPYVVKDMVFRSWGVCRCAWQMDAGEFMKHFSRLRLGAALGLLPLTTEETDALLIPGQEGHAAAAAKGDETTAQARAAFLREALGKKEE